MTYALALATGLFLGVIVPVNGGMVIAGLVGLVVIVHRLYLKEETMRLSVSDDHIPKDCD